jgi:dTDP-4-dehydrorhamnose reductase
VFDGAVPVAYVEDNRPNPLSCYGASKLAGERAINASGCMFLLIGTSWVYAAHEDNFMRTMLRLTREHDSLDVVVDQTGAPTGASECHRLALQPPPVLSTRDAAEQFPMAKTTIDARSCFEASHVVKKLFA